MNPLIFELMASAVAGVGLGLLFLWALWRSLRRLPERDRPGLWMAGAMTLRILAVVAVLFAILLWGDWRHVTAALVGFTLARWLVARRVVARRADATAGTAK
ncbi:hypothetical protein Tel_12390 [Candidatus Tenderia electrophaga]|jgi:F1F0 ATPase subunit 2|uniref:ATPase F0F1 n=1 Tax=Candidatus Tenderia electrophaga TaxID=1748243 RepID=A0A0S2TFL6_9GAMM|nr:hypothetical protein Tel_12390 [Candidatus Tenderia electrophaga]